MLAPVNVKGKITLDKFLLSLNPLENLVMLLQQKPNFDEIIHFYRHLPSYDDSRELPLHHYAESFKNFAIKISIARASKKYPDLRISRSRFVTRNYMHGQYRFEPDGYDTLFGGLGRVSVYKNGVQIFVYENLIKVGGIHTIIESSLDGFKKIHPDKKNILKAMTEVSPWHIIVIPDENLRANVHAKCFLGMGGLIAKFYTSKECFYDEVEAAISGKFKYTKL